MRFLLDTHVVLWWLRADRPLSKTALATIRNVDNTVFVSAASAWEIAIKVQLGRLEVGSLLNSFDEEMAEEGFLPLPITADHAVRAGLLGGRHKDPFDRMLAAQAQAESLWVVSRDRVFEDYGLRRIW